MATGPIKVDKTMRPEAEPQAVRPRKSRTDDKLKIFSGTSNRALTQEICDHLGIQPGQCKLTRFSDGENYVQILENVRG
jgi:ribose-phosphate pyrophosphokinase